MLASIVLPAATHPLLQPTIDAPLFSDATQRLQDCRSELLTLMAGTPTLRSTINLMLHEQLQLDGERVTLVFPATEQRGRSRIALTDACLYMQQHPALDTTHVPQACVVNLPPAHALAQYTVAMLLDELKALDLEQSLDDQWLRYWRTQRAPHSPVTCYKRVIELYRIHIEASAERALAEGQVHTEVLDPVFSLLYPGPATAQAPTRYTEHVFLKPHGAHPIALPGAWVLSLDTEPPVSQLLYVPTQVPAWQAFSSRGAMERSVLDRQQALFGTTEVDPLARVEYKVNSNPLEMGITLWLKQLTEEQYQDAIRPLANVPLHDAFLALQHVDGLDAQRKTRSLFAAMPAPPESADDTVITAHLPQFGLLHNGVDSHQRKALMHHHRHALENLLGSDTPTSERWQSFKQQLDALRVQQHAAETAARAMLNRAPLDLDALNRHYTALYQARLQGLRIEARIQRTLAQISEDELHRIESALASPAPDVVALTLSVTQTGHSTPTRTELNGPLVWLPPRDESTPGPHDGVHFIYWPGSDGGLQRFDSRQALEESVFGIQPQDKQLALQFTTLSRNPFDHSLSSQQLAFEDQAARIRQAWPGDEHASQRAAALEKLRAQTLPGLLIPDNSAREAAYLLLIEQHNARLLAEQLPSWLGTQTVEKREALKTLLRAYVPALKRAQALLERSLPPRDVFVRRKIDARIRKDFAIQKGFTLQLEMPDSVEQRRDTIAGSAPGTAVKIIDVPSAKRSKVSLDDLALRNLDADLSLRLGFVSVEVTADAAEERDTLKAGVTKRYLANLVTDLDLAKQYEARILEAFMGAPGESIHQKRYRRECLVEPWRLMLNIQGLLARMQNHISADALQLLQTAIDADTQAAWNADGKRIRLLPAHLSAGGADTRQQSPITLSGITFIEEQNSGNTLLYLPDAPDERYLRSYASLEQARIALFELCRLDTMVQYVAGRAVQGDVRAHVQRIDRATVKGYDAMIQAGFPWPTTTTLATHQLDAHMGRLLEAHRKEARSNDDLAHEKYALQSGKVFNGIKIALSFIPFIGTAVSLADATTSLYQAVAAFRRGDTAHGIDQLASVFECLVYAAMDALAIAAAPNARGSAARQLNAAHQLKQGVGLSVWRAMKSRQGATARQRFAGYEHPGILEAGSLQPVQTGPYRHTLRHTSGEHYILSEGRPFKVRFDATTHEMRLVAQGKYYAPAIALDQALQWDTYGALHGGHLTGYGGGSRRTRGGASRAQANVPAAVARQLPAAALEVNMQRLGLGQSLLNQARDFYGQVTTTTHHLKKFTTDYPDQSAVAPQKLADSKNLDIALNRDIDNGKKMHASFETAKQQHVHIRDLDYAEELNRTAHIVADRLNHLIQNAKDRASVLIDRTIEITGQLNDSSHTPGLRQALAREIRQCRLDLLDELDTIERSMKDMGQWVKHITVRHTRTEISTYLNAWKHRFTDLRLASMRSSNLMQALTLRTDTMTIDWLFQEVAVHQSRSRFDRALTTHMTLNETNISRVERNRVLHNCINVYEELSRDLSAWNASSPNHFDKSFLTRLQDDLGRLIRKAQRAIKKPVSEPKPTATHAVFETEDGQLLIGTEKPAGQQSPRQFIISDADGAPVEVWDKIGDGNTYRLNTLQSRPVSAPLPLPTDINSVVANAQARLKAADTFENHVRSYKTMEPVNLEHRLVTEAKELRSRANNVQRLDAEHPIIEQLRTRAGALEQAGEGLRIQRSLESKTPTEGYLDYLIGKGRVVIRKKGPRQKLRDKRPDGQDDYLQEYEVYDTGKQGLADKPIWYAHFHYDAPHSPFDGFSKAHLKRHDQQYLGMKWQAARTGAGATFADTAIWRGNIDKPFARAHFQPLG
ncbi:DUF6543 domain-containing protein [Pseudomonas sp.]|uniref:dermonecrotic toxin domain-containing protein n=1 Tax=Pseudomonas sp. TaxID=306 RepID=UPI0026DB56D1|nr:DUF6543 domain-containing protein [Pseudomonas sp.]MDO4238204.1 hypothetical protein [Pseudomonas sp.]